MPYSCFYLGVWGIYYIPMQTILFLPSRVIFILLSVALSTVDASAEANRVALHHILLAPQSTAEEVAADPTKNHVATILFQFDQVAPTPRIFSIHNPELLVIDFTSIRSDSVSLPELLPKPLQQIQLASSEDKTRIVISTLAPLFYRLQYEAHSLRLSLYEQKSVTTSTESAGPAEPVIVEELPITVTPDHAPPEPHVPEVVTEIIQLHYSRASDLKKTLESGQQNPLLSKEGILGVDERTNSLLIRDTIENLRQIRKLIKELDTPSKQVLIESRIVIATDDFSHELGARLGLTHLESAQNQWGFSLSGSSEAADSALSGTTPGVTGDANRLSVNMPVANPTGRVGLTLAKLATGSLIDLELSAAQIDGKTEIIASPRIITSDGYEATIQQGVQIPYRSDTLSGGTDINFKDAVMELRVTPQITPDHRIILTLLVKKDAVGAILCSGCEPSVDTREVKTRVMMENGETLVIGGIYEERNSQTENRVPLLADIPLIGPLFRSKSKTDGKDELLIFITPSILSDQNSGLQNLEH